MKTDEIMNNNNSDSDDNEDNMSYPSANASNVQRRNVKGSTS